MAKRLAPSGSSRRLNVVTHSYTNPYTGTRRSFVRAVHVRSGSSTATWNCRSPSEKLAALRSQLRARGLDNPAYVYMVILQAKQTCGSRGTVGAAYLNTAGTTNAYGYSLRYFWRGGEDYATAMYGCANYSADAVLTHEVFHILGGVPFAARASDGAGHIMTDHDILEAVLDSPFASSTGSTRLQLDAAVDNYRRTILAKPFDTTGYSASRTYRLC